MARITIQFSDENAAFGDGGMNEYGHVMTQVYDRIYDQESGKHNLYDSNGNKVGEVRIEK